MKTLLMAAGVFAGVVLLAGVVVPTASAQVRPAVTQDVDQPGRNSLTLRTDVLSGGYVTFSVPAGKTYVIDQYTGDCAVPDGVSVVDVQLIVTNSGVNAFFHTPVHYVENVGFGLGRYGGTGSGPFYADPGSAITLIANASSGKPSDFRGCGFVVMGHLISNP